VTKWKKCCRIRRILNHEITELFPSHMEHGPCMEQTMDVNLAGCLFIVCSVIGEVNFLSSERAAELSGRLQMCELQPRHTLTNKGTRQMQSSPILMSLPPRNACSRSVQFRPALLLLASLPTVRCHSAPGFWPSTRGGSEHYPLDVPPRHFRLANTN